MPYILFVVILNSMSHVPVVSRGQSCFIHPPSQEDLKLQISVSYVYGWLFERGFLKSQNFGYDSISAHSPYFLFKLI